jgi:hypothetical protein
MTSQPTPNKKRGRPSGTTISDAKRIKDRKIGLTDAQADWASRQGKSMSASIRELIDREINR